MFGLRSRDHYCGSRAIVLGLPSAEDQRLARDRAADARSGIGPASLNNRFFSVLVFCSQTPAYYIYLQSLGGISRIAVMRLVALLTSLRATHIEFEPSPSAIERTTFEAGAGVSRNAFSIFSLIPGSKAASSGYGVCSRLVFQREKILQVDIWNSAQALASIVWTTSSHSATSLSRAVRRAVTKSLRRTVSSTETKLASAVSNSAISVSVLLTSASRAAR
jgi:hypothetical protein